MNAAVLSNAWSHLAQSKTKSNSNPRMAIDPARNAIHLDGKQYVSLNDAVGWTVKPLAGTVWITLDQDTRDIVLEAGESFVVDRPGNTLISALGEARVCVTRSVSRCLTSIRATDRKVRPFAASASLVAA
jgi:hypothetical protein